MIKSYMRDYIHFLSSITQKTDLNILITFFTKNLYSIPHKFFWIEKYPETLHLRFITDGVGVILCNNSNMTTKIISKPYEQLWEPK